MKITQVIITVLFLFVLVNAKEKEAPKTCGVSIIGSGLTGAYTAYRLATDAESPYKNKQICLFEALDRVGGRVLSLSNKEVPDITGKQILEAGLYSYHTTLNPILTALIEKVFKIQSKCLFKDAVSKGGSTNETSSSGNVSSSTSSGNVSSSTSSGNVSSSTSSGNVSSTTSSTSDCETIRRFYNLRNKWFTEKDLTNFQNLPYTNVSVSQDFLSNRLDVCSVIPMLIPSLKKDLFSSDQPMMNALEMIQKLNTLDIQGVKLHNIDLGTVADMKLNLSSESVKFIKDIHGIPNIDLLISSNVHSFVRQCLIRSFLGSSGVYKRITSKGFVSVVDALIQEAKKNGVQIFNNMKLVKATRDKSTETATSSGNTTKKDKSMTPTNTSSNTTGKESSKEHSKVSSKGKVMLRFMTKERYVTEHAILAIGSHQMRMIDMRNLFKKANNETRQVFGSLREFGAHKIYLQYENAWWKIPELKNAEVISNDWIRTVRFFTDDVECQSGSSSTPTPSSNATTPPSNATTPPSNATTPPSNATTSSNASSSDSTSSGSSSSTGQGCRGYLEVSYSFGDPLFNLITEVFDDKVDILLSSPYTILKMNEPRGKLILSRIHKHLMNNIKLNVPQVKEPISGVFIQFSKDPWFRAGSIMEPTKVADVDNTFLYPFKDLELHFVGPDFAGDLGWERNYDNHFYMVERLLTQTFQMKRPEFFPNNIYENLVTKLISKQN